MSSLNPRRALQPTRTTLLALFGLILAFSVSAVRDFVWADLRDGLLRLQDLPRVLRGLIVLGFLLLLIMVGVLLLNDFWRVQFDLLPSTSANPGRGTLLPNALIPTTLFLLTIAWSFALAGALHSHPAARIGCLALYTLVAMSWIGSTGADTFREIWVSWLALLAVLLMFALRWRAAIRPVVEFSVLLVLVALTFIPTQSLAIDNWEFSGVPLAFAIVNFNVATISTLALPLLLLVGLDIANFAHQAAGWTVAFTRSRLPRWAPALLLIVLLTWLGWTVGQTVLSEAENRSLQTGITGYLGALVIPVLALGIWWGIKRLSRTAHSAMLRPESVIQATAMLGLPLILLYHATSFSIFIVAVIAGAAATHSRTIDAGFFGAIERNSLSLMDWLADITNGWQVGICIVAIFAGLWLARRGRPDIALFPGIFGAANLWMHATNPGRPLHALYWRGFEPVDGWWAILVTGLVVVWLVQRRLTAERLIRLTLIAMTLFLLRQTDFISDPFSPFFGFAGIGLLAFGLIWESLTIGSWANVSTPGLPRMSRIFLYLGYVLFTVTIVNWALASHDLNAIDQVTGGAAIAGLELFGRPLLYAIFVATLLLPPSASVDLPGDDPIADKGTVPLA